MLDKLRAFFVKNDRFAAHSGIQLEKLSPGAATAVMRVQGFHCNAAGVVHGGAIFTLADFAFAAASNSHNRVSLGVNTSVNFIASAKSGKLRAEATEISKNYKLASYNVKVYDDSGAVIADFNGMVYRKKDAVIKESSNDIQ